MLNKFTTIVAPVMMSLTGVVFIVVAFIGRIPTGLVVSYTWRKRAFALGVLFLLVGVLTYMMPIPQIDLTFIFIIFFIAILIFPFIVSILLLRYNKRIVPSKVISVANSPVPVQNQRTITPKEKVVDEKKKKFLDIPNIIFHFVNRDFIKDSYNIYFKEVITESVISEITNDTRGEIRGSIPNFIETKIGANDLKKLISNIRFPEISVNEMFLRYQKETIDRGQVILGLEEVDIELTELQAFEDAVKNLRVRFDLQIDESILDKQRLDLKRKAVERTLVNLEQASGLILIEGTFRIEVESNGYKCVYLHPVTKYLAPQTNAITISVFIASDDLEPHFIDNYAQSIGRTIPLKVYGHVWQPINRQDGVWDLKITPIVVY